MINFVLIFPLLACLILLFTKKKFLNNFFITLYAIVHFIVSIAANLNIDIFPFWGNTVLFEINGINKLFLTVLSIVYLAFAFYNNSYMKDENSNERRLRHYTYMIMFFIFSMTGAILSTNLGINWVFIEGTTLASAYLIYFHKTKHSIEAAWKYVFICSIGIALAFVGIILLTAASGNLESLYYKDLFEHAKEFNPFWLKMSFVFIMFGIGTKMGLAPVHFWLPDAHAEAPSPVSALLSAALLNSAFLMIINVFRITVYAGCDSYARIMLFVMGFLSLFVAAVFVYHISNYKRMLAYSSIENMGILSICLALGGSGVVAAMIHLAGHSFIKAAFFMTSGNILKIYNTKKIKNIEGLINVDKRTAWLWILSFLGIAAFPPSMLFISEFLAVKTMIINGNYFLCALFLFFLTIILYGLAQSVTGMVFGKRTEIIGNKQLSIFMYLPQILLLFIAFLLGIYMPDSISNIFLEASAGL